MRLWVVVMVPAPRLIWNEERKSARNAKSATVALGCIGGYSGQLTVGSATYFDSPTHAVHGHEQAACVVFPSEAGPNFGTRALLTSWHDATNRMSLTWEAKGGVHVAGGHSPTAATFQMLAASCMRDTRAQERLRVDAELSASLRELRHEQS